MNKLFTRIATLSVGLTLAIGMGVAAIKKQSVSRVDAASQSGTTVTFTASDFSGQGTSSTGSAVSTTAYGITVSSNKAFGTSELRVYQNGSFTISSSVGNITSLSFTFSGGKTGGLQNSYTGLSTDTWNQESLASQARFTQIDVTYTPSTSYTITYDANGGTGTMEDSTNTISECSFTAPSGKEFSEWNTAADGSGTSYAPGAIASSDLDLFAIWENSIIVTTYELTLSNSGVSGSGYGGGAERTTTISNVGFGSKGTAPNSGRIQLQGNNGIIYNTTAFPSPIASITMVQEGTNRDMSLQGGTSRLVNDTTADYSISGGSTTGITAPSTAATMEWTFALNTSYTYFALKVGSGNATYVASVTIELREATNDTTTALSIASCSDERYSSATNTWSGYDSYTLDISKFVVSCTTTRSTPAEGFAFLGIGYMNGDNFVARDPDFSSGKPTTADTRLCWRANFPTTAGGSTYLTLYVILNVSADGVSSLAITGSMTKTTYSQGEAWDPSGFTVNAYYLSAPSTPVNVTNEEGLTWSYNPATTASLSTTSVTCTATYEGQTAVSNSQNVTITEMNPIQNLYTKSSGASVDVYGYYVGFLDGTGPVIMDGEYGIVIYNKTADVSGYTEKETILHVTGSISIYNGLYEIGSASISVASGSYDEPDTPVVYATKGGETADKASRLTTVTGTPALVSGSFDDDAGTADIKMNFTVGANTIQVFYKKAAQTADANAFAAIKAAVADSDEITIKGFTGWFNGFQVQMNGYVPPAEGYTAEDFAQDLLDQTDAICEDYDGVTNNKTALEAVWSDLASNDKYPSLPSAEKTKLAEAARDESGTVVERAMARYDYLTGKYSLNNFINGRTPVVFSNSNILFKTSNNTMLIVVVASIATVSSIGLCILMIKKRKHQ